MEMVTPGYHIILFYTILVPFSYDMIWKMVIPYHFGALNLRTQPYSNRRYVPRGATPFVQQWTRLAPFSPWWRPCLDSCHRRRLSSCGSWASLQQPALDRSGSVKSPCQKWVRLRKSHGRGAKVHSLTAIFYGVFGWPTLVLAFLTQAGYEQRAGAAAPAADTASGWAFEASSCQPPGRVVCDRSLL
jgi:hypothetical protein